MYCGMFVSKRRNDDGYSKRKVLIIMFVSKRRNDDGYSKREVLIIILCNRIRTSQRRKREVGGRKGRVHGSD